MTIGLVIYLLAAPTLPPDALAKIEPSDRPLGGEDWRAIGAIVALMLPVSLFWATYEQQGNTIALWADQHTDRHFNFLLFTGEIPVTWFQAFNPFMIFAFTPFIVALWRRQGQREPATVAKMAIGCFLNAAAYLVMVAAAWPSGRRTGELALAVRLFRRHHRRRTLSVAGRAFAGDQGGARALAVDDDGRVAVDQLSSAAFSPATSAHSGRA